MLEDLPLFNQPPPSAPKRIEQDDQLERVSTRISKAIVDFCRAHLGEEFHADQLREHVERACGSVAPGSADRILRQLRQRGVVAYRVTNRSKSLYRVEGV